MTKTKDKPLCKRDAGFFEMGFNKGKAQMKAEFKEKIKDKVVDFIDYCSNREALLEEIEKIAREIKVKC